MHRDPIHCLIPDYMLLEIARRGDQAERELALETLGVSTTLRSARSQAEAMRLVVGFAALPSAPLRAPAVDRVIRDAGGGQDLGAPVVRREGRSGHGGSRRR